MNCTKKVRLEDLRHFEGDPSLMLAGNEEGYWKALPLSLTVDPSANTFLTIKDNEMVLGSIPSHNLTLSGAVIGSGNLGSTINTGFSYPLNAGNQRITSVAYPSANSDAANKQYVLDNTGGGGGSSPIIGDLSGTVTIGSTSTLTLNRPINAGNQRIIGTASPSSSTDATNRNYVDAKYNSNRNYIDSVKNMDIGVTGDVNGFLSLGNTQTLRESNEINHNFSCQQIFWPSSTTYVGIAHYCKNSAESMDYNITYQSGSTGQRYWHQELNIFPGKLGSSQRGEFSFKYYSPELWFKTIMTLVATNPTSFVNIQGDLTVNGKVYANAFLLNNADDLEKRILNLEQKIKDILENNGK